MTPRVLVHSALAAALLATAIASGGCANGGAAGALPRVSARPPAPSLDAVPAWALANPSSQPGAEIGIGSGASLDEATRYALRDVASRLSVSVESQLRDTISEDTAGTTVERLEQVIETRVTGARFAGWERTRSAERAGTFWAEVRIDRGRLARDARSELDRLGDAIDARVASTETSALRRLISLQNAAEDRARVRDLVSLVDVLDPGFDRARWEARRTDWRRADEAARRALVFEIRTDPLSEELADTIESRLVGARLRTRSGGCEGLDAVCIDIRSDLTETEVASRHIARIRSTVLVLEPGGTVFNENTIVGRGDSKSDRAIARRRALDDLRDDIVAGVLDRDLAP